jgi:hypothetical protein
MPTCAEALCLLPNSEDAGAVMAPPSAARTSSPLATTNTLRWRTAPPVRRVSPLPLHPHSGRGVPSISRTNRMDCRRPDELLDGFVMMARGGAPPPGLSDGPPSRLPGWRDQRRPCCLDWPHGGSSADAAPLAQPRSWRHFGGYSLPAVATPRPLPAEGVCRLSKPGSRQGCSQSRRWLIGTVSA